MGGAGGEEGEGVLHWHIQMKRAAETEGLNSPKMVYYSVLK